MSRRAEAQSHRSSSPQGLKDDPLDITVSPVKFGQTMPSELGLSSEVERCNPGFSGTVLGDIFQGTLMPDKMNCQEAKTFRKISEIKNGFNVSAAKSFHRNFAPFGENCGGIPPNEKKSQFREAERSDSTADCEQSLPENAGSKISEGALDFLQTDKIEDVFEDASPDLNEMTAENTSLEENADGDPPTNPPKWSIRFVRPPEIKEVGVEERFMAKAAEKDGNEVGEQMSDTARSKANDVDKSQERAAGTTLKLEIDYGEEMNEEKRHSGVRFAKVDSPVNQPAVIRDGENNGASDDCRADLPMESESPDGAEVKSWEDGPRPEMQRLEIAGKKRNSLRPWSMDVEIALRDIMGDIARPSEVTFEQMVLAWKRGYNSYFGTSLENDRFPYIWIDVHTVDMQDKGGELKFISIVGANCRGIRKLLALVEADPGDPELWQNLLKNLEIRGLANPRLFVGDSELPVWPCISSVFPRAESQYCWQEMKRRILDQISPENATETKVILDHLSFAENIQSALDQLELFKSNYCDKYPRAIAELVKNRDNLFTFFKYPHKHWKWIKNGGHLSCAYPADVLLTTVFKHDGFRDLAIYLFFNYLLRTQNRWPRLKAVRHLRKIQAGKSYRNGRPTSSHKRYHAIMDGKMQNLAGSKPRFSKSIGRGLSILNSRRSSGKSPVIAGPAHAEAGLNKADFSKNSSNLNEAQVANPVADISMDRWKFRALAMNNDLSVNAGNTMKVAKETRRGEPKQSTGDQSSGPISGLERELLEELKFKKAAVER